MDWRALLKSFLNDDFAAEDDIEKPTAMIVDTSRELTTMKMRSFAASLIEIRQVMNGGEGPKFTGTCVYIEPDQTYIL